MRYLTKGNEAVMRIKTDFFSLLISFLVLCPHLLLSAPADTLTRGAGIYPGAPAECHYPLPVRSTALRNLALYRLTSASSQYDYNLTPQLLTDGIPALRPLAYLEVTTPEGAVSAREREHLLDSRDYTRTSLSGDTAWITLRWHGMKIRLRSLRLTLRMVCDRALLSGGSNIRISLTKDGREWITAAEMKSGKPAGKEGGTVSESDPNKAGSILQLPYRDVSLEATADTAAYSGIRIEMKQKGAVRWDLGDLNITPLRGTTATLLPSSQFVSGWRSEGAGEQFTLTDLGDTARIEKIGIQWLTGLKRGMILSSTDGRNWKDTLRLGGVKRGEAVYPYRARARYVKVLLLEPDSTEYYSMGEITVTGRGAVEYIPRPSKGSIAHGRLSLADASWRLMRAPEVKTTGERISSPALFNAAGWLAATVPATVLSSYVNIGAVSDPLRENNIINASESYFLSPFWYRGVFTMPRLKERKHIFLNFEGVNRDAEVYLNGAHIMTLRGAFMRGRTDVTSRIRAGENVIAVKVSGGPNPGIVKQKTLATPDINGGETGADAPSFQATVGWDWMPTMRGRDTGIYDDVFLSLEGSISLSDPMVTTELGEKDTLASMTSTVIVTNNEAAPTTATLEGAIGPLKFSRSITLAPRESREVSFSPHDYAVLLRRKMRLWWPCGYGEPYLYDAYFAAGDDTLRYKAGIREVKARSILRDLRLYVNGVHVIPRGGSWGFSEASLNYGRREYSAAVAYHRDMNLNMIRSWVSQTAARAFYDAADSLGIMIWQDFWLANPVDGPDPADRDRFITIARDFVKRIRSHPSVTIYCGRNEGYPPLTIDAALRETVHSLGGDLPYISSSADDGTGGHGPYGYRTTDYYFAHSASRLHSEMGMPSVMSPESMRRTFSHAALWPQCDEWGVHDFTLSGAQDGAGFNDALQKLFGPASSYPEYSAFAQWLARDGYKAMIEGNSVNRRGLLLWMSHPAWPSMTWQTYDYYFEPLGAYFGTKKAAEPLHVQYDAFRRKAEVVNILPRAFKSLILTAAISDFSGRNLSTESYETDCPADTTLILRDINPPADYSGAYFIKLILKTREGQTLSENLYTIPDISGSYKELLGLKKPELKTSTTIKGNTATVKLRNTGPAPALLIRLKLVSSVSGEEILPAFYSDNYFHLLPAEEKTVTIRWSGEDAHSEAKVEVNDFSKRQ